MKRGEVIGNGKRIIRIRWIDTWKNMPDGSRGIKSRLVVKGCEESDSCPSTFAPNVSKEVIVLVLNIIASRHWAPKTRDIEKAILQSENLEREVYIQPPVEADMPGSVVWRLNRAAYGLGDAAREAHKKLDKTLRYLGLKPSRNEPALYYMKFHHQIKGVLVSHVDDLFYTGDAEFERIVQRLDDYIKVGKKAEKRFKFCGMSVNTQNNSEIWLGVELSKHNALRTVELKAPPSGRKMLATEEEMARSRIGTLQWYASLTIPDMCYGLAQILSELNKEKNTDVFKKINRAIVKLKQHRDYIHKIRPLTGSVEIEVYGDSAFKGNSSQQGIALVLRESQTNNANLISWRSNGSDRRPWSSLAAETHVAQIDMDKVIHIQNLSLELDCFIMHIQNQAKDNPRQLRQKRKRPGRATAGAASTSN